MNKILCIGILAMLFLGIVAPTVQAISDLNQQLIEAAKEGDLERVKALIAAGANVNAKKNYGETALMYTAMLGHTEITQLLIKKGADVNAKTKDGETALSLAKEQGHDEIVKLLIDAGARG
jgi:ankyrin repeat protein